jgi:hypothetical protein
MNLPHPPRDPIQTYILLLIMFVCGTVFRVAGCRDVEFRGKVGVVCLVSSRWVVHLSWRRSMQNRGERRESWRVDAMKRIVR